MRSWTWLLVVSLVAACDNGSSGLPVVGTLERDRVEITADSWETLLEVAVSEGDHVEAGQVLARQDRERATTRLQQADAAVERAEKRLAELVRGPRSEEIDAARARLRGAESTVASEEREFVRVRDLVERDLLSDSDLDRARARRDSARADRDQSRSQLEAMLEGTTVEELDQARAALAEALATGRDRRLTLERLDLRATRSGLVEVLPFETGDRPRAGEVVVVLLADGAPYARVYIPETIRVHVRPGMEARVRVDGVSEPYPGQVRYVASEAAFTPYYALTERDRSRLSYLAEIDLLGEAAQELPTGLPVEADLPGIPGAGGE